MMKNTWRTSTSALIAPCDACAEQPVGYGRKRFALVALDGEFRVSAVAPLLARLIAARNKADNNDLGIGVASMSGFSGTFKSLQVRGAACAVTLMHASWMEVQACASRSLPAARSTRAFWALVLPAWVASAAPQWLYYKWGANKQV